MAEIFFCHNIKIAWVVTIFLQNLDSSELVGILLMRGMFFPSSSSSSLAGWPGRHLFISQQLVENLFIYLSARIDQNIPCVISKEQHQPIAGERV